MRSLPVPPPDQVAFGGAALGTALALVLFGLYSWSVASAKHAPAVAVPTPEAVPVVPPPPPLRFHVDATPGQGTFEPKRFMLKDDSTQRQWLIFDTPYGVALVEQKHD